MAPPLKRRRLFSWTADTTEEIDEPRAGHDTLPKHGFAHTIAEVGVTRIIEHDQMEDTDQHIIARQAVDVSAAVATDVTIAAVDVAVTTAIASDASISVAVSTSLPVEASVSASVSLDLSTLTSLSASPATDTSSISINTASTSGTSSTSLSLPTSTISAATSFASSISTPLSTLSQSTSLITSSSISSISPTITSSVISSSAVSSKNITIAENVLTSALNSSTSAIITSSTGSFTSGFFSNSSFTYMSPSLTSTADSTADSTDSDIATSVVLTTATFSSDGQAATTITTAVGAGAAGYGSPSSATPTSNMSTGDSSSAAPPPPPPGTIAGGVVGGAAGVAILLLVAMLFLRWYRRRGQHAHQALIADAPGTYQDSPDVTRGSPGMAERAGIRPWAAAIPAMLRHQPPNALLATPQERSFQRVSGRKLPSAWSPGMDGPPPPLPYADGYRESGASSYYPSSQHEVANPFLDSSETTTPENEILPNRQKSEQMTVVPGPQRRPTIHNPQRFPVIAGADTRIKHMSSIARTSGTATTLLSSDSLLHPGQSGHFREEI